MKISEATLQYVRTHVADDVRQLALRGCKNEAVDLPFALQQIEGRQKAKNKLPAFYENADILFPSTLSMEQCSSEQTANYKTTLAEGNIFCDVTGGFGVDTLAFAHKFKHCTYLEPREELCVLMRHNCEVLDLQNVEIISGLLEDHSDEIPDCDLLLIDPSRRDDYGQRVVRLEDCSPNLLKYKGLLLKKSKCVMAKLSPLLDIKRVLTQLPETKAVHIVSVEGECKEILLLLRREAVAEPIIHCVNLSNKGDHQFTFTPSVEIQASPPLAKLMQTFLYEPNASILKAGAFKSVAMKYGLQKLHPHTHLYTSEQVVADFPGRVFLVKDVFSFHKQEIKRHLQDVTRANVSVRNFPLTAQELKQRLKLRDGGETYLFGTTMADEKIIVVAGKL